jgi:hypothetical protein
MSFAGTEGFATRRFADVTTSDTAVKSRSGS